MSVIKCKMCGGTIDFNPGETVGVCEFCGTKQTLPKSNDDVITNLFNRANNLRLKCEFDKAEQIYEKIVQQDDSEAEAHWGIILCKYGIEYVEDPKTFERIPTCHRTRFESIKTDADYEAAIDYADMLQQSIYEKEAREIDKLQKDILEIVKNEKPFDVFICYKETDDSGKRTVDSALANDIYHQLTQSGLKVFYAAITLEDKLGQEYEPYIFAALNSAKVMLAIGTKPEYFTSVWVKNEWSRFMNLMKTDRNKILIPCYRDMDAYDLPEEFAHLQAQDMSRIGFIQDIIRGVEKIVGKEAKATSPAAGATGTGVEAAAVNIAPLLRRAFMFLEDRKWEDAKAYCEKVLDQEPENAQAYLGKLMAERRVMTPADLANCDRPFTNSDNYKKAIRFGDDELVRELNGYVETINNRNENNRVQGIYDKAKGIIDSGKTRSISEYAQAIDLLGTIPGFLNADSLAEKAKGKITSIQYNQAVDIMNCAETEGDFLSASFAFRDISGFKDADKLAEECLNKAEEAKKKAEEARQKAEAVVRALLAGPDETAVTTEDAISEATQKKNELRILYDSFSIIIGRINSKKENLNNVESKISALTAERAKLGIFASSDKKRIDLEMSELEEKRKAINADLVESEAQLKGYSSESQIETDLSHVEETIAGLEEKLQQERESNAVEYSYEQALSFAKNNKKLIVSINPAIEFLIANPGDTVSFGTYPQSKKGGEAPIEWLVLAKESGKCLVISKYALHCRKYNEEMEGVTWENCSLRKWLNGKFYERAFSSAEKAAIATSRLKADGNPRTNLGNDTSDKVFLLSIPEVKQYFSSDQERQCRGTAFCHAQGAIKGSNDNCIWWLRWSSGAGRAGSVSDSGFVRGVGFGNGGALVTLAGFAVRPALWISIKS